MSLTRHFAAVATVVSLILATACGTAAGASAQQTTVASSEPTANGISVSGMGEVTGTPDTVEVSLGVSVVAETVDEAAATAAEKAQALIDSLTSEFDATEYRAFVQRSQT